jgi:hypothetical protein
VQDDKIDARVLAELSLFMLRQDLPWLLQAHRGAVAPAEPTDGCGREVLHALRGHGALCHSDLQTVMGRRPTEVERACGTA